MDKIRLGDADMIALDAADVFVAGKYVKYLYLETVSLKSKYRIRSYLDLKSRTRMHSSRMRTARLLTVSQHALLGGVPAWGSVPEGGCTCWGMYLPVPAGGYLPRYSPP